MKLFLIAALLNISTISVILLLAYINLLFIFYPVWDPLFLAWWVIFLSRNLDILLLCYERLNLFKLSVLDGFIWLCGVQGATSLLPCVSELQAPQLTSIVSKGVSSHSCQMGVLALHVGSAHTFNTGWWQKLILFSLLCHHPNVEGCGN